MVNELSYLSFYGWTSLVIDFFTFFSFLSFSHLLEILFIRAYCDSSSGILGIGTLILSSPFPISLFSLCLLLELAVRKSLDGFTSRVLTMGSALLKEPDVSVSDNSENFIKLVKSWENPRYDFRTTKGLQDHLKLYKK